MTDRLTEIRERAEAATPGPWSWLWLHAAGFVAQCDLPPHDITSRDIWLGSETPLIADDVSDGDGSFIAHARQDIPFLLDQIAERDARIERQGESIDNLAEEIQALRDDAEEASDD